MTDINEMKPAVRRTMTLFYIIDCSGSMSGQRIGQVNDAIRSTLPELQGISDGNADAQIKVAALTFSNGASWVTSEPKECKDFQWTDINAGGQTALGEACKELESKLSRESFLKSDTGNYAPTFILISDGEPTDDFEAGLEKLKKNNWFAKGIKFAIAVVDANKDTLAKFTGSGETVIEVKDVDQLKFVLRSVSVSVSRKASQSSHSGKTDSDKQADAAASVQQDLQGLSGVEFAENVKCNDADFD